MGRIIPTDFHTFQRGRLNHQPVYTRPFLMLSRPISSPTLALLRVFEGPSYPVICPLALAETLGGRTPARVAERCVVIFWPLAQNNIIHIYINVCVSVKILHNLVNSKNERKFKKIVLDLVQPARQMYFWMQGCTGNLPCRDYTRLKIWISGLDIIWLPITLRLTPLKFTHTQYIYNITYIHIYNQKNVCIQSENKVSSKSIWDSMLSLAGLGGMRAIMLLSIIGYPAPSAMKVSQGGNQLRDKVATFHLIIWTCRWRIRTCSRGLGCLWHITRAHTSVTADMPWGPRLLSWFSRCIPMLSFVLYLQLGRPFVLLYSYISWEVNHLFFFHYVMSS